jgi:hypothetical protein
VTKGINIQAKARFFACPGACRETFVTSSAEELIGHCLGHNYGGHHRPSNFEKEKLALAKRGGTSNHPVLTGVETWGRRIGELRKRAKGLLR